MSPMLLSAEISVQQRIAHKFYTLWRIHVTYFLVETLPDAMLKKLSPYVFPLAEAVISIWLQFFRVVIDCTSQSSQEQKRALTCTNSTQVSFIQVFIQT